MGRFPGAVLGLFLGAAVGIGVIAYLGAGAIYDYRDTVQNLDRLPTVDAIVCLSGGRGRIRVAGDLWHRYFLNAPPASRAGIPILYLSGLGPQAGFSTLETHLRKEVMKDIIARYVIMENESTNTEENALWLRRYQRKNQWKKVLLVTSNYHMRRSKLILEKVLGQDVSVETYSVEQEPLAAHSWRRDLKGIRVTMTEYLKWLLELAR